MGRDDDFGRHVHNVREKGDGVEGDSEILIDGRWNFDAAALFTSAAVVQWRGRLGSILGLVSGATGWKHPSTQLRARERRRASEHAAAQRHRDHERGRDQETHEVVMHETHRRHRLKETMTMNAEAAGLNPAPTPEYRTPGQSKLE